MRQRFWEIGGNRIGNVIGVVGRDAEAEAADEASAGEQARMVGVKARLDAAHET